MKKPRSPIAPPENPPAPAPAEPAAPPAKPRRRRRNAEPVEQPSPEPVAPAQPPFPSAKPIPKRTRRSRPEDTSIPAPAMPPPRPARKKATKVLRPGFEELFSEGPRQGRPRCRAPAKEDDPERGINPATNRPFRRASNRQCKQLAAPGYTVCVSHGAAPRNRVRRGEKKDPKAAAMERVWPGWSRLGPEMLDAATHYHQHLESLSDLPSVLVLAHLQLETIMRTGREAGLLYEQMRPRTEDGKPLTGKALAAIGPAIGALDRVSAIQSRSSQQIDTILKVLETQQKRTQASEGVITPAQFLYTLNQMQERVRALANDQAVPREQIADRLVDWLYAFVNGQAATAGPA